MPGGPQVRCCRVFGGCLRRMETEEAHEVQGTLAMAWFGYITQHGPLKYLFQFLQKLFRWRHFFAQLLGRPDGRPRGPSTSSSPDRPVRHARKRLGTLARLALAFVPSCFHQTLHILDTLKPSSALDETLKTHVHPSGKGCKRKQDDLLLEEQQYWVKALQEDLPEEDEEEDPTYEPTKSETDSEEYRSQNSTETDLEFEERNGVVMLKEKPTVQEDPPVGLDPGQPLAVQVSGNGGEWPALQGRKGSGGDGGGNGGETLAQEEASDKGPAGSDPLVSSGDSQDHWVCVSGE